MSNKETIWDCRCLADDESLRLHKRNRSVAVVNDDEEAEVFNISPIGTQVAATSSHEQPSNAGSSQPHLESNAQIPTSDADRFSIPGNTSNGNPQWEVGEPSNRTEDENGIIQLQPNVEKMVDLWLPVELNWEEVLAMSGGMQAWPFVLGNFEVYNGVLADQPEKHVMMKRFAGHTNGVVEAEKRVATFMSHKNIMRAMAYHESPGGSALVYQYSGRGTLEQYLDRSLGRPGGLTCGERTKVAIEIAQGIHYMHEQCPCGPVVHGNIRPGTVFLERDYQALISGFGRARWLKIERMAEETHYRCWYEVPSDHESIVLQKGDVFDFGVLLLRLFCQRKEPQDDSQLLRWARPLLRKSVFHELIDQDMKDIDMYEMYRVMNVAAQCTKDEPISRPSFAQVLSFLRGEHSCCFQLSPSPDSSLGREINGMY